MSIKLIGVGVAALLISACSSYDDTACTDCGAKTRTHVKVAAVHHKPRHTAIHLPTHAKPGQCWGRVRIPAQFESRTERVMVHPATTKTVAVPAKYGWVTKSVLVREASEKVHVIPATYREVSERVLVAPMQTKVVPIPAQYRTETEQVLVTPAGTKWIPKSTCRGPTCRPLAYKAQQTWKRGAHGHHKVTQVMCLVRTPAVYKTVTRRVLINEASSKRIVVRGPTYRTVIRRVVDQPSRTIREKVPAEYKTVRVREVIEPASERQVHMPAVYKTVTKQVETAPAKHVWKQVICKAAPHKHHGVKTRTKKRKYYRHHRKQYRRHYKRPQPVRSMKKAGRRTVRKLQLALKSRGFNPGHIDGIYGPRTRAAMVRFQRANRMAEGHMTFETVRRLGLASMISGRG